MSNPNLNQYNALTQFTAENQPKGRGRRKDRYKQLQKEWKMSIKDHEAMLHSLLSKNREELLSISEDKEEEIIIGSYARAILMDYDKGELGRIDRLVDRLFGRSVERVESEDKTDYTKQLKNLTEIRQKIIAQTKTPLTGGNVANNNQ